MDNTEGTRTCGLCHKNVAEANFALHETHCRRFLCLCPDCGETVPKEQLEQHREEEHTETRCSECFQKMERCRLKDHKADECVERLQACKFCDLELPWKKLAEHCLACGSRTELCRDCNRFVKLSDQPEHASTCSSADNNASPASTPTNQKRVTVSCSICMLLFPAEDLEEHELECASASGCDDSGEEETEDEEEEEEEEEELPGQVTIPQLNSIYRAASLSPTPPNGPLGDGGDQDQISICPHCSLALPLVTLRRHQTKCQIYAHLK